ncbi:MAG: hypothetical protein IPI32_01255 [Austwickia sp.]|jgi:2-dehydropantoate 2-reductase|nr:hypothetical protein [Austwickia sp.]MBK8437587.1 hypothetical protein [Austwickia sp.]MBK9102853.1 hypothetical protein [Austwickia sp.]
MATVVVMGMGAMGSVYAALLAGAGHQVHGVCLWPEHARAVAKAGLRVYGASGDRTVRLASVGTQVPEAHLVPARGVDLVIVASKSFDVTAAARAVAPLVGPHAVVQAIQNGIGATVDAA